MPIVTLNAYLTHVDQYDRIWFSIPASLKEAKDTRYKLMSLDRVYGGCSPIRFQSFYTLQKKPGFLPAKIEQCKGSLVEIKCEFKNYWGAPMPNPNGWNLTVLSIRVIGSNLTLC